MASSGRHGGEMFFLEPGGADDMRQTRLCGQIGMGNGSGGRGEIQHGLRAGENFQRIILDRDATRRRAHHLAQILTNPVMARTLGHAGQHAIVAFVYCLDQHLTHATRTSHHCNGNLIHHDVAPRFLRPNI